MSFHLRNTMTATTMAGSSTYQYPRMKSLRLTRNWVGAGSVEPKPSNISTKTGTTKVIKAPAMSSAIVSTTIG